jgi:hypothetical protein
MPVATLDADGIGNYDAWLLGAGADKVVAVNLPDDDNTSYVLRSVVNDRQSYTIDDLPPTEYISDVSIYSRCRLTASGNEDFNHFFRLNGTDLDYATKTETDTTYTDYSDLGVARPGGGPWGAKDFPPITQIELGIKKGAGGSTGVRCTTLYTNVTYTPPAGDFLWIVSTWIPPLMAVASHGLIRDEMVAALKHLRIRPASREDLSRLFEAFFRRPRFSCQ